MRPQNPWHVPSVVILFPLLSHAAIRRAVFVELVARHRLSSTYPSCNQPACKLWDVSWCEDGVTVTSERHAQAERTKKQEREGCIHWRLRQRPRPQPALQHRHRTKTGLHLICQSKTNAQMLIHGMHAKACIAKGTRVRPRLMLASVMAACRAGWRRCHDQRLLDLPASRALCLRHSVVGPE